MAAELNPSSLVKRNKRQVATMMKQEWKKQKVKKLGDFLDYLLNPLNPCDNFETIDWCRFLVSGGETFEEFSKKVRHYDTAVSCGLVWTADFVAYRCRTCGISPCMSLCNECFQMGNHDGHDYNMFRSQAGGACDCGDINVMNPAGFCPRHGPDRDHEAVCPPTDLLAIAEIMMPKLFQFFLLYLRDNWKPDMKGYSQNLMMADAEQFLGFLHNLSDMGAAMRGLMTSTLTNADLYPIVSSGREGPHKVLYEDRCKNYLAAIQSSTLPKEFVRLHHKYGISTTLKHQTLLDELVFWMMKYEFPERIVTLLLGLLPDHTFKESFVRAFIMHYTRISVVLVNAVERSKVANRVLHISVQLFSNENLSCQMADDCHLLYIVLISLYYMIESCKIQCTMETDPEKTARNYHCVVDCASEVMKDHCYWPIISDVINLLQHHQVALKFMTDHNLVGLWMELLSFLQGMNINQRELVQHIQFEPDTYYAAFSAELEMSASPLWCLLAHCKSKETSRCILNLIAEAKTNLEEWFTAVNLTESSKMHPYQLTFHLPLHRYLALAIMQAVRHQQIELSLIPLETDFLCKAFVHVLQVQVGLAEILAGMWVRNGLQMKGQAMTYIQSHFSYSMADADIFFLQLCASKLDPDYFVSKVLEKFHIQDWLTFDSNSSEETVPLSTEQKLAMVDGALTLFVNLMSLQTYLGMDDKDLMRLEMVSLLCMADRQHSALQDQLPEKAGLTSQGKELFDPLLEEIADYKAPHFDADGGLQQGTFVPKGFLWEQEYDPVHVQLRAIYRRDYQASVDRYTEYLRQNGLYTKKSPPWPPFRKPGRVHAAYRKLYQLLNCPTMHTFLFSILHKSLDMFAQIPESILYNTVHLLDLALSFKLPSKVAQDSRAPQSSVPGGPYELLFRKGNLAENACVVIQEVTPSTPPPSCHSTHPLTISTNMEASSLEEMFMVAPSAIVSSSGPIVAAHSGVTPSYPSLSLSMSSSGSSPAPSAASQCKPHPANLSGESSHRRQFVINESFLSLLLKLHMKITDKGSAYVPLKMSSHRPKDSLFGDGAVFIGQLLDRLSMSCSDCEKLICQIHLALCPQEDSLEKGESSQCLNVEERQRRARQRQKKLLAQFASRQKAFMEKTSVECEAASVEEDVTDSCEEMMDGNQNFECVICNESTPSTVERPIGLAVFLQATSILGHRQQVDVNWRQKLSEERPRDFPSCAYVQNRNLEMLFENFEEPSCQLSVNIGWEGGVLVETCGHYLHLHCHHSYIKSLGTQNPGNLAVQKGEYWCPVCRQLSNSVVPIIPEENKRFLILPSSKNLQQMCCDLGMMMNKQPLTPYSETCNLNKAMVEVIDDLTSATYTVFKKHCLAQSTESFLLFMCSIARINLELELLQREGALNEPVCPVPVKKLCFLPLMQVLSLHCKMLTPLSLPYPTLWSHVTGVAVSPQAENMTEHTKEVPLLLRDVSALLIHFVLALPLPMEKEQYHLLVRMLHNVVYLQALCVASCKMTAEEREAWRAKGCKMCRGRGVQVALCCLDGDRLGWGDHKGAKLPLESLEGILSFVITRLGCTSLYNSIDQDQLPAISQSVWSPQSVQSLVEEQTLPFLRLAALMKQHLYGQISSDPTMDVSEYQFLCESFGLLSTPGEQGKAAMALCTPSRLSWAVSEPRLVTLSWFSHLSDFLNSKPHDAKVLLLRNSVWHPPSLIQLPKEYYTVFEQYRRHTCTKCNLQPKEPALCLVCGQFLCFREPCCRDSSGYECVQHSITCGAGTGVFLLVVSSIVVIIRGSRASLWGSIHLDEHGEEDRDLKRGRPLYLSLQRFNLLQSQWLTHTFDQTCKKWIWHRDRL